MAYRTFTSVAITGLIDEELVGVLPEGLKFIAHNGMFRCVFLQLWQEEWYNMAGSGNGICKC